MYKSFGVFAKKGECGDYYIELLVRERDEVHIFCQ